MCGIAGIVTIDGSNAGMAHRVELMQRALAHRGPDGAGSWISAGRHAAFANTRLAIIDPSPAARQPMTIDNGRLALTFNGEIYNFVEVRRDLEARGVAFQTRSDAEVVLRAFDAYGDACLERLRGMFAFAIWNQHSRCLTLARDRFGIKPLYYALQHDKLVFASELRAIAATGLVSPAIDSRAAYEYFRSGSVPEPRTMLSAVKTLEAAHVASWQDGRFVERRYWDLRFRPSVPAADAAAAVRGALADSVQRHLVSDVPVGVFLSGGVDSAALLALAHAGGHRDLRAVTMALPGTPGDETELAQRTAAHFGAAHESCAVDAASARAMLSDYFTAMDQPGIDGLNTLVVSRVAQARGLKVMLSGLGADELFGGYKTLQAIPRLHRWHRLASIAGPLARAAGGALEHAPDARWRRVGDLLGQAPSLDHAYLAYRGIFTRAEARRLTSEFLGTAPAHDAVDNTIDPHLPDATMRLEVTRYLRNQLLRDADVMGMACGVEIRVPFIDAGVVDTMSRIEHQTRFRPRKALLTDAVPELPRWVVEQPKRGFMFPVDEWLRGEWHDVFADHAPRGGWGSGPWYRQWCVRAFVEFVERGRRAATAAARPAAADRVLIS